jgi:hypothetical protein
MSLADSNPDARCMVKKMSQDLPPIGKDRRRRFRRIRQLPDGRPLGQSSDTSALEGCPCQKLDSTTKSGLFPGASKRLRSCRAGAGSTFAWRCELGECPVPTGPESSRMSADFRSENTLFSSRTILKPPAVRSGDAARRPPAVQRPTPTPAVEPVWSPGHLSPATSACAPRGSNRNTT